MQWIDSLSTGFNDIDKQHKELFEKFGAFLDSYENEGSEEAVFELFVYLKKYVHEHFQCEEHYMQKIKYPKMLEHVEEHRKLLEKVEEFNSQYGQKGFTEELVEDIRRVLTDWLLDHIVKTDMALGSYLKGKQLILNKKIII